MQIVGDNYKTITRQLNFDYFSNNKSLKAKGPKTESISMFPQSISAVRWV